MFVPQEQRQDGPSIGVGAIGVIEATLNDTEDLLRQVGWVNGNPRRFGGEGTCLGMALASFNHRYKVEYFHVHELMLQAAQIQTGMRWRDVPEYNDARGRTVEDVWNLFKIARELLHGRELQGVDLGQQALPV